MTRALRLHAVPAFTLESGERLVDVRQAYHLDGALNERRDNLVVVVHALTGSADAAGAWWSDVIGPSRALDTSRYAVLCTNLLGSCYGTSYRGRIGGPARASDRATVTTRDQARLIQLLVADLGAPSVALVTGGSLGGMVALELAATFPRLARHTLVFAAPAAHTAYAIGLNHVQRRAVETFGTHGLALARMLAMLTYRTPRELETRFGRRETGSDAFDVQTYLSRHGEKLVERFTAEAYLSLLDAMDAHDVARGRESMAKALAAVSGRLTGVGITGDLLYAEDDVRAWTDASGARYRQLASSHGHDAFLLEPEKVGRLLSDALAEGAPATRAKRIPALVAAPAW